MKSLFYFGLLGLLLFEIAAVYFIMPLPGSQEINSLQLAYFLYRYRWFLRILFAGMIAAGIVKTYRKNKWLPSLLLVLVGFVTYFINANMFAEAMFKKPNNIAFARAAQQQLPPDAVVIAVKNGFEARAFPVRYIAYHHQVPVTVYGKKLLVTYCDVCRSGYVFDPVVDGVEETFRLVGMDHYNAMIEDATTGSWWRQATGEAVTGKRKGKQLALFPSQQMSLGRFFELYPNGSVMLPDPDFANRYDNTGSFENGKDTDPLTRTDTASWKEKSWVVGITVGGKSKAYDWNALKKMRVINDTIGTVPIALILDPDDKSFFALERLGNMQLALQNDTVVIDSLGRVPISEVQKNAGHLPANQVFWHTWRTFHPNTTQYPAAGGR